jgi:hypothetical protein
MCKYCDKISNIDETDNVIKQNYALSITIDRSVYDNGSINVASIDIEYGLNCYDYDHFYESIEIKYCRFCGKNLLENR